MIKKRVLIVDDEVAVLRYVSGCLSQDGYEPILASDGKEGLALAEKENLTLVILDIMMPGLDGFEICRRLREWSQVPIIMLSARGDEKGKVKCLDLGADDYLTKPFGVDELRARVRAVLRRTNEAAVSPAQTSFSSGHLNISFAERRVSVGNQEVRLTPTEYILLQELVLNADKVLTHRALLTKVWGPEYADEREYLHVFVGRLRKQIEPDPENPAYIITIPRVGYQFKSAP